MSTVNAMADVQTGQGVVLAERLPSELTEPKFTAQQIETDCPDVLKRIGKEIAERVKEADKQIEQAQNHSISVDKLIAQARELCNDGGFTAFQKMFFPDLGKSRVYELLAIGTNKKSAEEIRSNTRARVAKHRAIKAKAPPSVTVTEKSTPQTAAAEGGAVEHPRVGSGQPPEPSKPWSACASAEGMRVFTAHTLELQKRINKRPPRHFSATVVSVEILEQLGHFFIDLATLKKFKAGKPAPIVALPDNGTAPVEQPAGAADRVA